VAEGRLINLDLERPCRRGGSLPRSCPRPSPRRSIQMNHTLPLHISLARILARSDRRRYLHTIYGEPHFRLLAKSPACPSCAVNHGPPGCHELQQKSSRVAKLRSCASTYKAALRIVSPQPGTLQGRRGKTAGYRARLSPLHLLTRQLGAESAWSTGARSPGSPQGQGCCTGD
jgi:hypothetical protein